MKLFNNPMKNVNEPGIDDKDLKHFSKIKKSSLKSKNYSRPLTERDFCKMSVKDVVDAEYSVKL